VPFAKQSGASLSSPEGVGVDCRQGEWSAIARLHSAEDIAANYFIPAEELANKAPERYADVFLAYASFCDSQYKTLLMRKDEMRTLQDYQDRKTSELKQIPSTRASSSRQSSSSASNTTVDQARRDAEGIIQLDRNRLERFSTDIAAAVLSTNRLYAQVLLSSDGHDDSVYRLVALWLEHHADEAFNNAFAQQLTLIPSRKFVPLAHQLSARMSKLTDSTDSFRSALDQLVGRLAREHPFHILYHIYSLRATAGSTSAPASAPGVAPKTRKSLGMEPITSSQAGRHKLASDFFAHAKSDPRLASRVQQLELACEAYVEAAILPRTESAKKSAIDFPSTLKLLRLKDLKIPVSTYDLPTDPTMQYRPEDMPCIQRYDKTYRIPGGINAPKLVTCQTTQSGPMRQLVRLTP
jgi:ataxia telangiectasia mutated family protein